LKDPDLESFVEGIEKHFRARRGTDHALSPRDFNLARSWHDRGVPLATVLVGVDRAFESGDVTSLAYCRKWVEELASSGTPPRERPSTSKEQIPLGEIHAVLVELQGHLARLQPGPAACFEPPLRKIQEVQDLLSVAARPNWEYLRRKLQEIDDDVSASLLSALSPEDLATFRAEATRAVERHRGKVTDEALEDALSRYLMQRARERLGLRRVLLV
jgi:hypothetical protein